MATEATLNPWTVLRGELPGYSILRIIDLERAVQAFQIVRAERGDASCGEFLLDGVTLIRPEGERSAAEIAEIIHDYDEAWRTQHAVEPAAAG